MIDKKRLAKTICRELANEKITLGDICPPHDDGCPTDEFGRHLTESCTQCQVEWMLTRLEEENAHSLQRLAAEYR